MRANETAANFRVVGPDETASNRLAVILEATSKTWMAAQVADRRTPCR